MAQRPVFVTLSRQPFHDVYSVDFTYNSGFAVSQKQKNIMALHTGFNARFPQKKVLEISSKSLQPLGVKLSAFNLKKFVPSLGYSVPVECVFQGGKVFAAGGPYTDLYTGTSRDAKGDPRLKASGALKAFEFEGVRYPLQPMTAFYDWLYINALMEKPELGEELTQFDAFTDIEFNPNKGINCQARAAAIYVGLARQGLLESCRDFGEFVKITYGKNLK